MGQLAERRNTTDARIKDLLKQLQAAEQLAKGKACVYATGSFGRFEASVDSDLDLFIAGKKNGEPNQEGKEASLLKRLDEICIKADLIDATRKLGFPEFSGDGVT